jgi:hypothetical protein
MIRRGRPPFQKTPEHSLQVVTLSANGFPDEWIAEHLRINLKTLVKYFGEELKAPKKVAAAKLKLTIYQRGMKGELVAALAWLNNHGWGNDGLAVAAAPLRIGISFEDGGPGRARRVPYDQEANERAIKATAPGADFLPGTDQPTTVTAQLPARAIEPSASLNTKRMFELCALSVDEFDPLNSQ